MSAADAQNRAAGQTVAGWINQLKSANGFVKDAAQQLVPVIEAEIVQAASEQRSVDGKQWKPTKRGTPALKNVAKYINARAVDNVILITLRGHYVFHHFGAGRVPQRAILPTKGLPQKLGSAIAKGLIDMGPEWMTRKGRHDRGSGGVKMKPSMGGK